MDQWSDPEALRRIFEETRVVRRPFGRMIDGHHVLPSDPDAGH